MWWITLDGATSGLLSGPDDSGDNTAVWSPDGQRVAIGLHTAGAAGIDTVRPDGSGRIPLTRNPSAESEQPVAWSPDGRRLLISSRGATGFEAVVVNADGTGRTTVRKDAIPDAWSPDGSRLLFHDATERGLKTIRTDGSGLISLPGLAGDADWHP